MIMDFTRHKKITYIGKIYLDCIKERYMRIMTITRDKKIAYRKDI